MIRITGTTLTSLKYCKYKTDNKDASNTMIATYRIIGKISQNTEPIWNGHCGLLVAANITVARTTGKYKPTVFFNSLKNSIVSFDKNKLAPDDGNVIKTLLSSAM